MNNIRFKALACDGSNDFLKKLGLTLPTEEVGVEVVITIQTEAEITEEYIKRMEKYIEESPQPKAFAKGVCFRNVRYAGR